MFTRYLAVFNQKKYLLSLTCVSAVGQCMWSPPSPQPHPCKDELGSLLAADLLWALCRAVTIFIRELLPQLVFPLVFRDSACLKSALHGSLLGGLSTLKLNNCFNCICPLQHEMPSLLPFHCHYFSVPQKSSQDSRSVKLWAEHRIGKESLPVTDDGREKTLFYPRKGLNFLLFQLHLVF